MTRPTRLFQEERIAISPNPNEIASPRQVLVLDMNADELPDGVTANCGTLGPDGSEGFGLHLNRLD
ncbi:MAG: hypothetical protein ACE5I3_12165 [Phycisphaerae bacterium]